MRQSRGYLMTQSTGTNPIEEVIEFFAHAPSTEEIAAFRLSDVAQEHVRRLLAKNSDGMLSREEDRELDKIMTVNEVISLIRARAQAASSRATTSSALTGA